MVPEVDKPEGEKGYYLHPKEWGVDPKLGLDQAPQNQFPAPPIPSVAFPPVPTNLGTTTASSAATSPLSSGVVKRGSGIAKYLPRSRGRSTR